MTLPHRCVPRGDPTSRVNALQGRRRPERAGGRSAGSQSLLEEGVSRLELGVTSVGSIRSEPAICHVAGGVQRVVDEDRAFALRDEDDDEDARAGGRRRRSEEDARDEVDEDRAFALRDEDDDDEEEGERRRRRRAGMRTRTPSPTMTSPTITGTRMRTRTRTRTRTTTVASAGSSDSEGIDPRLAAGVAVGHSGPTGGSALRIGSFGHPAVLGERAGRVPRGAARRSPHERFEAMMSSVMEGCCRTADLVCVIMTRCTIHATPCWRFRNIFCFL